ncbi:peptide/nickel transport system permease protein [Antricoccus suffuscus]|uniref:Peptide/nickel transport system permease protein n=1 Tax=Antricoccus suffuscus TaxID=1629062 RepID=A0A2T0ZVV6_9ACTN|nr:ABC transporter permease [Antricoccus suffuscus]PRZ40480.1 peptide/nickel transport system permease protein [Antricoccus suffuscus]
MSIKPLPRARSQRLATPVRIGIGLFIAVVVIAIVGPIIAKFPPNQPHYADKLQPPSGRFWLGTDQYGRDQFARTVVGLRLSLISALVVLIGSSTVSLFVGMVAGLSDGWVDRVISRIIDVVLAIPSLVLALAIVGLLGPGYLNLLIALVISSWATDARISRALTLDARNRPYVAAARVAGISRPALGIRHVLPAVLPQVFIISTLRLGGIVVSLAGLSFLGLGVQMPTAELGAMLGDARRFITAGPWLLVWPSLAILAMAAAANLIAEGLHKSVSTQGRQ